VRARARPHGIAAATRTPPRFGASSAAPGGLPRRLGSLLGQGGQPREPKSGRGIVPDVPDIFRQAPQKSPGRDGVSLPCEENEATANVASVAPTATTAALAAG